MPSSCSVGACWARSLSLSWLLFCRFVRWLSWLVPSAGSSAARLLTLVGSSAGADRLSPPIQWAQFNDFISFKFRNLLENWKASYKVRVKWKTQCGFWGSKKQGSGLAVWKALEWFKFLYKVWLCSYCHFHFLEDVFNYKPLPLQLETHFLTNIKQCILKAEMWGRLLGKWAYPLFVTPRHFRCWWSPQSQYSYFVLLQWRVQYYSVGKFFPFS